jgi:DNA-binding response OmpR family regulator
MKILLIEDDVQTGAFIVQGLQERGFSVQHYSDGEDGLYAILNQDYDLAVIDIMLPNVSGLDIIKSAREQGKLLPVIILSAKASLADRLEGFKRDVDDYITKPYSLLELYARIQAILRRSKLKEPENSALELRGLRLDLLSSECFVDGKSVALKPKEFKLLRYFLTNINQVLTKTMLLEHIWGYDFLPETNVVEVCICRLRNKLLEYSSDPFIHTVRGLGYILK